MTATPLRGLVALDLDGTLLRNDKSVADADARAIAAALASGLAVTLATGRLVTGALPTARRLALSTPLICADGGLLIDPATGDALERRAIAVEHADEAVRALLAHGLVPYVFSADAIHCEPAGRTTAITWCTTERALGRTSAAVTHVSFVNPVGMTM